MKIERLIIMKSEKKRGRLVEGGEDGKKGIG